MAGTTKSGKVRDWDHVSNFLFHSHHKLSVKQSADSANEAVFDREKEKCLQSVFLDFASKYLKAESHRL